MTQQELYNLGFKKKIFGHEYWFQLKYGKHTFITNDSLLYKEKDKWFIGYHKGNDETFWFNYKLNNVGVFKIIFHLLTNKEFKLHCQQK